MKNLNVNAAYALSKAKDAIENWKLAVAKAKNEGTKEEIAFCEESLRQSEENFKRIKAHIKTNWTEYL